MWLGLLTFSKNKPVLAKDMDLKALIKDAYSRGRMIAVLPFVEKVLAGCKDTKVGGLAGAAAAEAAGVWSRVG
jgi:CCR4-NOT transcription complex subunit 1